jgi:hypothetical protein
MARCMLITLVVTITYINLWNASLLGSWHFFYLQRPQAPNSILSPFFCRSIDSFLALLRIIAAMAHHSSTDVLIKTGQIGLGCYNAATSSYYSITRFYR